MRLLCAFPNAVYTIVPRVPNYDALGRHTGTSDGLEVRPGPGRVIDTDLIAANERWSSDTKRLVEEYLLGHPHFGFKENVDSRMSINGEPVNTSVFALWFAPDQDLGSVLTEHREFIENQRWFQQWSQVGLPIAAAEVEVAAVCMYHDPGPPMMACTAAAAEGSDYCEYHGELEGAIPKGREKVTA
jgi:hypothetical protein